MSAAGSFREGYAADQPFSWSDLELRDWKVGRGAQVACVEAETTSEGMLGGDADEVTARVTLRARGRRDRDKFLCIGNRCPIAIAGRDTLVPALVRLSGTFELRGSEERPRHTAKHKCRRPETKSFPDRA